MSHEAIIESLGKPFYQQRDCLIYNMDCLEAMEKLPEGMFHLTVTSPPYNIGKEYEQTTTPTEYVQWCKQWIGEVHRITHAQGAFWLNLGYMTAPTAKALPIAYLLWDQTPFYMIQEVVWHYGAGVAGRHFYSPRNEKFLWYVKSQKHYTFNLDDVRDPDVKYPNQKKNGKLKVNPLGKNPTDVWEFPKVTSGHNRSSKERTAHPAQFPEAVIERVVRASSNPCEIILDPFLGSGTTAVVALKQNRSVVGFEVRRDYCEIAACRVERLASEEDQAGLNRPQAQPNLFGAWLAAHEGGV